MHHIGGLEKYRENDGHETLLSIEDKDSGLKAFVGIHSTRLGPALGGTRLQAYASETEAIEDVLRLSKAMSYKCALANLPYGGGKAVIVKNSGGLKAQLRSYAEAVSELAEIFKTGTDVGISDDDVKYMSGFCSNMLGVTEADRENLSTSDCAALGVYHSIKTTKKYLGLESKSTLKVAIKGVGKLGGKLAELLAAEEADIIVADTSPTQIKRLKRLLPNLKVVSPDEIHRQDVDIYAPCSLGGEVNDSTLSELKCKAVVGGANNQLLKKTHGQSLHARNILYAPDYVANAGGLIYVADELEPGGFSKQRVIARIQNIAATIEEIYKRSKAENISTDQIADTIAVEKITG